MVFVHGTVAALTSIILIGSYLLSVAEVVTNHMVCGFLIWNNVRRKNDCGLFIPRIRSAGVSNGVKVAEFDKNISIR